MPEQRKCATFLHFCDGIGESNLVYAPWLRRFIFENPMTFSSKRGKMLLGAGALAIAALSLGTARFAVGSDHADTVESVNKPGIDLTDLHIFPGQDSNNVVLALSVRPLIPAGQAANFSFDSDVLYQFKIDTTGDAVEDLVIQARFEGTGANQKVFISGPVKPTRTGVVTQFEKPYATTGTLNQTFSPTPGMKVFAGARADSFFLDLNQLGAILPDRLSALDPSKKKDTIKEANTPQVTSFRAKGEAKDFFDNLNLLSIVVELPKSRLGGGKIGVWETASTKN